MNAPKRLGGQAIDLEMILNTVDEWGKQDVIRSPALFRLGGWLIDLPPPYQVPSEYKNSIQSEIITAHYGRYYSFAVYHVPRLERLTSHDITTLGHYIIVPVQ